jgi:hypothetical protein
LVESNAHLEGDCVTTIQQSLTLTWHPLDGVNRQTNLKEVYMLKNLIDAQLSKEDEDLAVQKVRELEGLFPFLLNLGAEERIRLPKMGKSALDFAERSLIYAKEHDQVIAPFRSVDEHQRDLDLLKQLQRVLGVLEPFTEMVKDTYMQLGAEAYAAARDIYNIAKRAAKAGVPGAEVIVKDLAELYKRQRSKSNGSEPVPEPVPESGQRAGESGETVAGG